MTITNVLIITGVKNQETKIETTEEIGKPTDSSNSQDFSTTEPYGNVSLLIFYAHGLYHIETRS